MIKYLIFDLDNTIYPSNALINQQIPQRMISFVAKFLNLTFEQAKKLFSGPEAQALLNNKNIYDIIAGKAKEDERYYSIMIYMRWRLGL